MLARELRKLEARIPLIDLRRVGRYGPCDGRLGRRPCSKSALRDDIHFPRCSLAGSSDSLLGLGYR
jgi:hypothetical protein